MENNLNGGNNAIAMASALHRRRPKLLKSHFPGSAGMGRALLANGMDHLYRCVRLPGYFLGSRKNDESLPFLPSHPAGSAEPKPR
jgi:hypothetical protein